MLPLMIVFIAAPGFLLEKLTDYLAAPQEI